MVWTRLLNYGEIQPGERTPRPVGSRTEYPPRRGHLFDLLEPEDVVRKEAPGRRLFCDPEGLYGTRTAEGRNKAAKLQAIREARRTAKGFARHPNATARVSSGRKS